MEWYWILTIVLGSVFIYSCLMIMSWCLLKSSSDLYKQEEKILAEIKLKNIDKILGKKDKEKEKD